MLKLSLNRKEFLANFLAPISNIGSICMLNIGRDVIKCTLQDSTNTLFAYFEYKIDHPSDDKYVLNIADINKLVRALSLIDEDVIELIYSDDNKIVYNSTNTRFVMHLLDANISLIKKFDFNKVLHRTFTTQFSIEHSTYKQLLKAIAFAETDKLYLTNTNNVLNVDLTDKTKTNTDMFSIKLSDDVTGLDIKNVCLPMFVLKNISTIVKQKITVKYDTAGVILFEYADDVSVLKFATTSLKS